MSLSLLLPLSAALLARADDHIRAVRVSNVVGSVQIMNGTETQFSQAYPNMPLMEGSTLKTGEDGRAEIQFEDGSLVRLTPNSSATMGVLGRNSEGGTNTEVDLQAGLAYVQMKAVAKQRFVVHFRGDEVISSAPVKFRVDLDGNPSTFAVLDGSARLSHGTAYSVEVKANETVRFEASDPSRYFLAEGVDGDSWDQWNADRDQAMNQMAARETREARGSGNSGDPAWSDLDYYGNWYSSGSGGSFWVPDGAGAGWDPYGLGSWGFYGGAGGGGYAWISGYPWGWLPYNCGTWNYFNSFGGWGWFPGGGCGIGGAGWYPYSGIGNAPPRYRRLPRPQPVAGPVQGTAMHRAMIRPLIPVNRGPEATRLDARVGAAPKTLTLEGHTAQLLPKSENRAVATVARPSLPGSGRVGSSFSAGERLSSVPAYRPSAPVATNRAATPSVASHASGGFGAPSHGSVSSPSASMSSAGHGSAGGSMGGGSSAGGGHH